MSGEKLTLEIDDLIIISEEEDECEHYIKIEYGAKEFKTNSLSGNKGNIGETFNLGEEDHSAVKISLWKSSDEDVLMGERIICTDQLRIGTGTDEKYLLLNDCEEVANLRIISKFQATALGNLIGEYLRDKVLSEMVIFK
jgi:hypothetical protein